MAKRGLGKRLDELLASSQKAVSLNNFTIHADKTEQRNTDDQVTQRNDQTTVGKVLRYVALDTIKASAYQPRQVFDEEALQQLADSIKAQGLIQPVVLRPRGEGVYELIAGERRWRASKLAGLAEIPAVVQEISDQAALAMGLIENIQREDLNPIEEAQALRRLIDEFSLSQLQIAEAIGRSRSAVANMLRLLNLNYDVRVLVERGAIDSGHAKVLLALNDRAQSEAACIVAEKALSVRETEQLVKRYLKPRGTTSVTTVDPNIRYLQQNLSEKFGTKVVIQQSAKGKGKLIIHYHNHDALDGILAKFK
ncbi:MAG: ParB/RepB/Spo0J family partition protein [Pseudomonadota bacterium]